jgi:hypothetical protein
MNLFLTYFVPYCLVLLASVCCSHFLNKLGVFPELLSFLIICLIVPFLRRNKNWDILFHHLANVLLSLERVKKTTKVEWRKVEEMNQLWFKYIYTWKYHKETSCGAIFILNKQKWYYLFFSSTKSENRKAEQVLLRGGELVPVGGVRWWRKGVRGWI